MTAFASAASRIGYDLTRDTETIRLRIPAQGDHYVRRIGRLRVDRFQWESAFKFFTRKNHACKIGMLEPFNEPRGDCGIVLDDVEQNRAAISSNQDLSGFRCSFESGNCVEPGGTELAREINPALDRGETVIGDNEDIGSLARIALRERFENVAEVAVRPPDT